MNQPDIGKHILKLRKQHGMTQEELASAINISAQAVSKWETGICLPDAQTLPLVADYFNVSIDYLFYGKDTVYSEVYEQVMQKVSSYPQMSKESYEEAHKLFAAAHHGIIHGSLRGTKELLYEEPLHISDTNGLSLLSGKGYGAIVTRGFFENITDGTLQFATPVLETLAKPHALLVVSVVLSMNGIGIAELAERAGLNEDELREVLDGLVASGLIIEKVSKHKAVGKTYELASMYHTCICILLATLEMQRRTMEGISCCMGFGDYPINVGKESL